MKKYILCKSRSCIILKYGYFNYDPVGPSVFFYVDENGQPKETQFHIAEPEKLIEAVSACINAGHIDHVLCNYAGLGLSDSLQNYLMNQFNYNEITFELNSK